MQLLNDQLRSYIKHGRQLHQISKLLEAAGLKKRGERVGETWVPHCFKPTSQCKQSSLCLMYHFSPSNYLHV